MLEVKLVIAVLIAVYLHFNPEVSALILEKSCISAGCTNEESQ